jgi:hypothetical protein
MFLIYLAFISLQPSFAQTSATGFGTPTNWDYLIGLGDGKNPLSPAMQEAVFKHSTGLCDGTRTSGKKKIPLKVKPGKLSHVTLDYKEVTKPLIQRLENQGVTTICYMSIGSVEDFRYPAIVQELKKEGSLGGEMNGWPGEHWLRKGDTPGVRAYIDTQVKQAKEKGCKALEFDNLDPSEGENKAQSKMEPAQNIQLISYLNAVCGQNTDIACGFKNALEMAQQAPISNFKFLVNESCQDYDECRDFKKAFAGKPILNIRYDNKPVKSDAQMLALSRGNDEMKEVPRDLLKSCGTQQGASMTVTGTR